MRKAHRIMLILAPLIASLVWVPPAWAHPLGNFTINHYAGLIVNPEAITIDYVLDMAEIPAFQEIARLDADRNGELDEGEAGAYPQEKCEQIRAGLALQADGRHLPLSLAASSVAFPPGAGGLATLRLSCTIQANLALKGNGVQVAFEDSSYKERLGWREITVTGTGVDLLGEFSSQSISDRLQTYPNDLLNAPLDQSSIQFTASRGTGITTNPAAAVPQDATSSPRVGTDAFTQLITIQDFGVPTMLLALGISLLWGAMHAMTPGHGKALVGAYLVGSRGTARHALFLGLTTTITHTSGVFALGLVTLFASQFILPERLFPWLSVISGILVVTIGVNLLASRLRAARLSQDTHHHDHHDTPIHTHPHPHDHTHDHPHDHDHVHAHDPHAHEHAGDASAHGHLPPLDDGSRVTWRSLLALGVSGGLLPCPSALVLMLSAIALDRIGLGIVFVVTFSLGLAGVLTGIGLLLVYARHLFERVPAQNRIIALLPAASALFITIVGVGITIKAVGDILA